MLVWEVCYLFVERKWESVEQELMACCLPVERGQEGVQQVHPWCWLLYHLAVQLE